MNNFRAMNLKIQIKFSKTQLTKIDTQKIRNLSNSRSTLKIYFIYNLPKKKTPVPDCYTVNLTFKEEITPIQANYSKEEKRGSYIKEKRKLYKDGLILILKN